MANIKHSFLFVLGLATLLSAGCGGGDTNPTSTSSSSTAASSSSSITSSSSSSLSSSSSSSTSNSSSSSSISSSSNSPSSSTTMGLSIRVDGNKLKNSEGQVVQLRGASLMGMEFVAIQGWSPGDPWGGAGPNFTAIKAWGINVIRIPLNQTSWFNISCVDSTSNNAVIDSDPGNNYKSTLKSTIDQATQQGLYVIIDLHLSAPKDSKNAANGVDAQCAPAQNVMADSDYSIQFWSEVATAYKSYPNVMFELFNEPYLTQWTLNGTEAQLWTALRDGAMIDSYVPLNTTGRLWRSAGFQQMLDAVRATGATNVVLTSGMNWAGRLEHWYSYRPIDSLSQLAAVWHAYATFGAAWGTPAYSQPNYGESAFAWAQGILDNGIPVVVTEFGDYNKTGTVGSPFASTLLPRLDAMGISYLGWTFTAASLEENQLIKDKNGTPTDGYGVYVKSHYLCRAAGTQNCP